MIGLTKGSELLIFTQPRLSGLCCQAAMENPGSPHRKEYEKIRKQNLHKMDPIPVCKIPS